MSWFSRGEHAFVNLVTGKAADTQIVLHPTTPIEKLINNIAPAVLQAAAKTSGAAGVAATFENVEKVIGAGGAPADAVQGLLDTLERDSGQAAKAFINAEIGPVLGGLVDLGAQALAGAAIREISHFKNMPARELAEALDNFLQGLSSAPSVASAKTMDG